MPRLKDAAPEPDTKKSAILEEHLALAEMSSEVMELARGSFDWEPLGLRLGQLQVMLDRHFELEEQGGYMSHVRYRSPRIASLVERLERAHGELRSQLALVRRLAMEQRDRIAVRSALLEWVDVLSKHEAAEKQLLLL